MYNIEKYSFGKIFINGKVYTSDLIIYPDGSIDNSWWRENGHRLIKEDIKKAIAIKPDMIIIGTGAYGFMKPDKTLLEFLEKNKIEYKVSRTKKACAEYNKFYRLKNVVACFHLTC